MLILPYINLPSDEPFWVSSRDFYSYFDQHDFEQNRKVKAVQPAYRAEWFPTIEGVRKFELPIVNFVEGKTQFISGRHRTAVLLPHMRELPFAIATDRLTPEQLELLASIPKRPLLLIEPLSLPDLPPLTEEGE